MKNKYKNILIGYNHEPDEIYNFLEKHWLEEDRYIEKWLSHKNEIFNQSFKWFPEQRFHDDFILRPFIPGVVFYKESYESLMSVLKEMGEEEFVIIRDDPNYFFGLEFKVTDSWEEIDLEESTFLMTELFCFANNYFVFGKSGKWGKYTANEHENWVDIMGFKPEYLDLFRKHFPISEEEKKDVEEALPEYRNNIVW